MSRANGGMNLSVRAHAPGSCTPFITWRAMDKGLTRDAAQPAFAADGGWSDDEPPRLKRWPLANGQDTFGAMNNPEAGYSVTEEVFERREMAQICEALVGGDLTRTKGGARHVLRVPR